jgi:putative phage-type endonuclease
MAGLSDAKKEARKKGIGGSEVATLLLPDHAFSSPLELFLDKTGQLPERDFSKNEAIEWGNRLESEIANKYSDVFNAKLMEPPESFVHPEYNFLVANPDRLIVGEKKGLEIKNVGLRQSAFWGPSGTDLIAEYYVPQVMHYLLVLDYDNWDVAALVGGNEFRYYHFQRDKEYDEIIIEVVGDFWNNHVTTGIPPAHDWYHPSSKHLLKKLYKTVEKVEVSLPRELLKWRDIWMEAKSKAKEYENVIDGAQSHILSHMGNASVGKLEDGTSFLRKEVKRKAYTVNESSYIDFRFNAKAQQEEKQ